MDIAEEPDLSISWNPFPLLALLAFLAGCNSFDNMDVKVNERVVFTPRPLFTDYSIVDPALATCVEEAIASQRATSASELRTLRCDNAGIENLAGLDTFTALDRIDLRDNAIEDVAPLAAASAVQVLLLSNNNIVNPVPLYKKPALQQLDLRGNSRLLCPDNSAFFSIEELRLPRHCGR